MIDTIFEVPETWKDTVTITNTRTELQYDEDGVETEVEITESYEEQKDALKPCCWHSAPSLMMPGTRVYEGKKIIHALIESEAVIATVLKESKGQCLAAQGQIIPAVWDYSPLDGYEPVFEETFPIDPETELPVTEPVLVLTNPAPEPILVSAATREIIVPMNKDAIINYLPDIIKEDEEGTLTFTLRPEEVTGLHQFGGRPWSI